MKVINTLVLSGGSIRGVAYIGVFKKIEEIINSRKYLIENNLKCDLPIIDIKTITAVSVGTIFSLAYILGYNYIEMLEQVLSKRFDKFKSIKLFNFINKYGLDSGDLLIKWLADLMTKKGVDSDINLLDFYNKTKVDFQIMATNLNKYRYKKFNYLETPKVKVLEAIRMSISIPFIFTANEYEGDLYVDGGLIDSYPISLYEDNLENLIGIKIVNNGELIDHQVDERIDDIESFIYHVITCYMVQKEKHTSNLKQFKDCTVYIHTKNIATTSINFALTPLEKNELIQIGYNAIEQFLE
jgi:predicted acylesterase/phospholipase RssA